MKQRSKLIPWCIIITIVSITFLMLNINQLDKIKHKIEMTNIEIDIIKGKIDECEKIPEEERIPQISNIRESEALIYGKGLIRSYNNYITLADIKEEDYITNFIKGITTNGYLKLDEEYNILTLDNDTFLYPSNGNHNKFIFSYINKILGMKTPPYVNIKILEVNNKKEVALALEADNLLCMTSNTIFTNKDYEENKFNFATEFRCIRK